MPKKEFFLKAIRLARRGYCLGCWEKRLHKSGIGSYFCSYCGYTIVIEKDCIIIQWYVIKHGSRILRNRKIHADSNRWKEMIDWIKKHP